MALSPCVRCHVVLSRLGCDRWLVSLCGIVVGCCVAIFVCRVLVLLWVVVHVLWVTLR